jgi:lysozyme
VQFARQIMRLKKSKYNYNLLYLLQYIIFLQTHKRKNMTINKNSSLAEIKAWQSFLHQQGFTAVGDSDGHWGPNTKEATSEFQSSQQLSADGNPGHDTIAAAIKLGFTLPAVSTFSGSGLIDVVFDLSHNNKEVDLIKAKNSGMSAVFHKATQSLGVSLFHDPMYHIRQSDALKSGLLWGAYHFGSGGSGKDQAKAFLDYTKPENNTLLVLDFEPNTTKGESTMGVDEAADFVNEIFNQTGKYPGLYSGPLLHQHAVNSTPSYTILTNCWLWIAEYSPSVNLPPQWKDFVFWQYTDGTAGPSALPVEGVGQCDRDVFKGTNTELIDFWHGHSV